MHEKTYETNLKTFLKIVLYCNRPHKSNKSVLLKKKHNGYSAKAQALEFSKSNIFQLLFPVLRMIMMSLCRMCWTCAISFSVLDRSNRTPGHIFSSCGKFQYIHGAVAAVNTGGSAVGTAATTPVLLDISQSGRRCSGPLSCWTCYRS